MVMTDRIGGDFGTRMKRAREERGMSLRQIASSTKISVSALEALERNDISRLPGGIFSRAFVRSYALEIGLDPEQTVREFIAQFPHDSVTAGSPHVPQEDHEAIESERQSAQTALKLVAISLPLVGAILYFTLANRPREAPSNAASAPPAVSSSGAEPTPPPSSSAVPVPPPAPDRLSPAAELLTFEILATRPVALEVTVDGARHESRTVAAGERLTFRAEREMTLKMGDAGAVQLTINGQPAVALGAAGEPRTVQIGRRNYGSFLASQ